MDKMFDTSQRNKSQSYISKEILYQVEHFLLKHSMCRTTRQSSLYTREANSALVYINQTLPVHRCPLRQ